MQCFAGNEPGQSDNAHSNTDFTEDAPKIDPIIQQLGWNPLPSGVIFAASMVSHLLLTKFEHGANSPCLLSVSLELILNQLER